MLDITLYGFDKETYKAFTKISDSLDNASKNLQNYIESAPVFSIQSAVLDSFRDMVAGDIFLFFQVSYSTCNF